MIQEWLATLSATDHGRQILQAIHEGAETRRDIAARLNIEETAFLRLLKHLRPR